MRALTHHQEALVDLCRYAFVHGASDIHIEPGSQHTRIRIRVDGTLRQIRSLDRDVSPLFLEQAKQMLGFNMAISGVAQDAAWNHPEESADFRCNLIPTKYGEKICLRVLERGKSFHLNTYPLNEAAKHDLFRLIEKKSGLIIVSGPTGSGKSTLLYSILGSLDRDALNISTVEDPVEYELAGLNQVPIRPSKGFRFAEALRALMRQDPDVVMVGEIRDEETAEAAIHAASTGHLVLTTVHANSAIEIENRLTGLGIKKEPLLASLLFASAQRLPRALCPQCKEDAPEDLPLIEFLFNAKPTFMPKKACGCEACEQTGIKGRRMLFEYLKKDESIPEKPIIAALGLKQEALALVEKGEISAKEAYAQFN